MDEYELHEIVELIEILQEDPDTNKRLRDNLAQILKILQSGQELAVTKALGELEELSSQNLSSYQKTQLWDIISRLEAGS